MAGPTVPDLELLPGWCPAWPTNRDELLFWAGVNEIEVNVANCRALEYRNLGYCAFQLFFFFNWIRNVLIAVVLHQGPLLGYEHGAGGWGQGYLAADRQYYEMGIGDLSSLNYFLWSLLLVLV